MAMLNDYMIWTAKDNRVYLISNGKRFEAVINAGMAYETHLSVGYSYPNYAWNPESRVEPEKLEAVIEAKYKTLTWGNDLMEQIPNLLELARAAN